MDAIHHFDLSLHRGIQDIMDLRNDPASSRFVYLHDRFWAHCLLLSKIRLFPTALCYCAHSDQHAELPSSVHDEDRLSFLLFRSSDKLLVSGNLFYHGHGSLQESLSGVSDDQNYDFCNLDDSFDQSSRYIRNSLLYPGEVFQHTLECY